MATNPQKAVNIFDQNISDLLANILGNDLLRISTVVVLDKALSSAEIDDMAAQSITAIISPMNPFGK